MTKRLRSYVVDERYSKTERIKIDGTSLFVFGIAFIMWFLFIYLLFVVLNVIAEGYVALIALLMLAALRPLIEHISIVILKKNNILRVR